MYICFYALNNFTIRSKFQDFLSASLENQAPPKEVIAPRGANSFLQEFILIEKGPLEDQAYLKEVYYLRKEFAPSGANSFL